MQIHFADWSQIRRTIRNATQEVLLSLSRNSCCLEEQVDLTALRDIPDVNGVRTRVYVPSAVRGRHESCDQRLATLSRGGVVVHATPRHTPRMAIIDRSVVVLACNQSDYSDGALIGQELPITAMLVNALTETAAVETVAAVEAPPLDSRSRNVLRQLTLGATDEKGARELGITLRTYRRIVSRLMEVLDAESRFQAGYLAMKRNWL